LTVSFVLSSRIHCLCVCSGGVGAIFGTLACILSFTGMYLFYLHTTNNKLRRYVLRVMMMVPIYAINAWLGLAFKNETAYFDIVRETYEAFVIYSFYQFLVAYLGGRQHLATLMATKAPQEHKAPVKWLMKPWDMQSQFYRYTKFGTMQYVPIKLLCAVLTFIFSLTGIYHGGDFTAKDSYIYIAFITNASQLWAMYCLIMFYLATKPELKKINPFGKFLCIKSVVFFTFWQSVIVAALVKLSVINATTAYTVDEASEGLQDFLICIEMFIGALAHWYCFPWGEFAVYKGPVTIDIDKAEAATVQDLPSPDLTDRATFALRAQSLSTRNLMPADVGKSDENPPLAMEENYSAVMAVAVN
jgi:hypothetical protein